MPWLAYRLHETGLLESLDEQRVEIQQVLKQCAASHMFSELELGRLTNLAGEAGVDFVVFKYGVENGIVISFDIITYRDDISMGVLV